jgi:hypothetical protein
LDVLAHEGGVRVAALTTVVRDLLASAQPHPQENPAMHAAWRRAEAVLAEQCQELRTAMGDMVRQTQASYEGLVSTMPDVATTPGQKELAAKHGTPRGFAAACVRAIGDMISCGEAEEAISKYKERWEAA